MSNPPTRHEVLAKDAERKVARQLLKADAEIAKSKIAPAVLKDRWKGRQKRRIDEVSEQGKQAIQENAPALSIAAAGLALFAVRKPIGKAIRNRKERKLQT